MPFTHDVCIVGTGRVGLPLGLSFVESGISAFGLDIDPVLRATVNAGRMPFHEPGYDALVASRRFQVHADPALAGTARAIVITVGTPLHTHIETDLSQVRRVIESLLPHLRPGQLLCLRSTVAPGTTAFVEGFIERHSTYRIGEDLLLAFCPERIAEGKAHEELRTLPQIVGAEDPASLAAATELFGRLAPEILPADFVTAELVKLFNNIARYVHFALANQFALVADTFGANIYAIRQLANHKYPRSHIASPGLTAGTCLRKDFGMINEWSPYPDMLLSAWKMNEYIPAFLVKHLGQRISLRDRVVAVLGYTFKQDTDDTRDSLAPKLVRYLERSLPAEIRVTDHHLPDPIPDAGNGEVKNWPLAEALRGAECVFVATNHTGYREALRTLPPEVWVADLWNVGGAHQVFYQARALTADGAPPIMRA